MRERPIPSLFNEALKNSYAYQHMIFILVSSLPQTFTNANLWWGKELQRKQPLFIHLPNILDP